MGNIYVKPKEITTVKRPKTSQNSNGVNSENSKVNNKINPKSSQKAIHKKVKKQSIKIAEHHKKLTIKHKRNPIECGVDVEEILNKNKSDGSDKKLDPSYILLPNEQERFPKIGYAL